MDRQWFETRDGSMSPCPRYGRKAIGMSCFNRGLLCVEDVEDFYIVLFKREADEVFGIGLDEIFGDRIIFGHVRCLASDG